MQSRRSLTDRKYRGGNLHHSQTNSVLVPEGNISKYNIVKNLEVAPSSPSRIEVTIDPPKFVHDIGWVQHGFKATGPSSLQTLAKPRTLAWPLHKWPQYPCGRSSRFSLNSLLAQRWWNKLPTDVRTVESQPLFGRRIKTSLFRLHLDTPCKHLLISNFLVLS